MSDVAAAIEKFSALGMHSVLTQFCDIHGVARGKLVPLARLQEWVEVGAGFSGSFPALNIAVLCACVAMGLEITYISSVGSSTYGANNPALTYPEIAHLLYSDGLISTDSSLVTMGGDADVGLGMDEALAAPIRERLTEAGLSLMEQPDYAENITQRKELYAAAGIDCFVAVGGNTTSLGRGESSVTLGQGVLQSALFTGRIDDESGLVQFYLSEGLPVINLLNIKQITTDYALPFDPKFCAPVGESAVFYLTRYPKALPAAGFAAALCVALWAISRPERRQKVLWKNVMEQQNTAWRNAE